jgi:hypothetical protein
MEAREFRVVAVQFGEAEARIRKRLPAATAK